MADETKSLDILIRTKAELAGARALEEQLQRDIGKAKALGEDFSQLSKKLETVQGSIAKAGQEEETFTAHGREMHKLLHQVSDIAPGAGLALRAAFHPENIGIAALLIVIKEVMGAFEEMKKKAEEAAQTIAEKTLAVWEAQRKAHEDATKAADDYANTLKKLEKNANALKTIEAEQLEILNAQLAAREKLAGKDETRKGYLEADAEKERIGLLQRQLSGEKQTRDGAAGIYEDANRNRQTGSPLMEKAAEAQVELGKLLPQMQTLLLASGNRTPGQLRELAKFSEDDPIVRASILGKAEKQEELKKKIDEASAVVAKFNRETEALAQKESEAKATLEKADADMKAKQAEIDKAHSLQVEHQKERFGDELRTAGYKPGSVAGATGLKAIEAEEAVAHGDKLSNEQQKTIAQVVAALKAQHKTQADINKLLTDMMDLHTGHAAKIKEFFDALGITKSQVKQLENRTNASRNP